MKTAAQLRIQSLENLNRSEEMINQGLIPKAKILIWLAIGMSLFSIADSLAIIARKSETGFNIRK